MAASRPGGSSPSPTPSGSSRCRPDLLTRPTWSRLFGVIGRGAAHADADVRGGCVGPNRCSPSADRAPRADGHHRRRARTAAGERRHAPGDRARASSRGPGPGRWIPAARLLRRPAHGVVEPSLIEVRFRRWDRRAAGFALEPAHMTTTTEQFVFRSSNGERRPRGRGDGHERRPGAGRARRRPRPVRAGPSRHRAARVAGLMSTRGAVARGVPAALDRQPANRPGVRTGPGAVPVKWYRRGAWALTASPLHVRPIILKGANLS